MIQNKFLSMYLSKKALPSGDEHKLDLDATVFSILMCVSSFKGLLKSSAATGGGTKWAALI